MNKPTISHKSANIDNNYIAEWWRETANGNTHYVVTLRNTRDRKLKAYKLNTFTELLACARHYKFIQYI